MVGEISPDMMFWMGSKKLANMGADGYNSVRMGSVGLVIMGGEVKHETAKINSKMRAYTNI